MSNMKHPERERILNQALKARTLPEIVAAVYELNLWVEKHSDDLGILDAYEVLENMREIAEFQQMEQDSHILVKAAA
jgi:hypothetical protein